MESVCSMKLRDWLLILPWRDCLSSISVEHLNLCIIILQALVERGATVVSQAAGNPRGGGGSGGGVRPGGGETLG